MNDNFSHVFSGYIYHGTYSHKCHICIEDFVSISGLHCNLDKTLVIPIGGNFDVKDILCPDLGLTWEDRFTIAEYGGSQGQLCLFTRQGCQGGGGAQASSQEESLGQERGGEAETGKESILACQHQGQGC